MRSRQIAVQTSGCGSSTTIADQEGRSGSLANLGAGADDASQAVDEDEEG